MALLSLTESMRNHPDRYNDFLLLRDNSSSQDGIMRAYKEMLPNEAEGLYHILVNDLNNKIMEDIICRMSV